jgi:carbon storage regulator
MLVLSRQRDETIMIGDDIEITVVDIRGDKVRLGINAPARIAVHRKEVYEAIRAENERAAGLAGNELTALNAISSGPQRNGRSAPSALPGATRVSSSDMNASGPNPALGAQGTAGSSASQSKGLRTA